MNKPTILLNALALLLTFLSHRVAAADATNTNATWTIPIEIVRGRVMVSLHVNEDTNRHTFLLDSGYGISMIHPALVESLKLRRVGGVDIIGIAGRETAGTYEGANLRLGPVVYSPRRIASLPSDAKRKRREDGILGAGFFKRYVVEIDGQSKMMRLHEPKAYEYSGKGQVLALEFPKDTPVIDAEITDAKGNPIRVRLEIDTGCDSAMCLGSHFVQAHELTSAETKSSTRVGVGGGTKVRYGEVPQLKLGRLVLEKPRTSFFLEGSPTDETQAGHIGMPALLKFKVIFDYSRKRVILED